MSLVNREIKPMAIGVKITGFHTIPNPKRAEGRVRKRGKFFSKDERNSQGSKAAGPLFTFFEAG